MSETIYSRERIFHDKLINAFNHVLVYENPDLQAKARSLLQEDILLSKAKDKLVKCNLDESYLRDFFLVELLDWFKNDFFNWVDRPDCISCQNNGTGLSETILIGNTEPTTAELADHGYRVELYECTNCHASVRFPRYNCLGKLLETRKGRCGEWANCFVLICRSFNFNVRHILDWTDHVWAEVYSDKQNRWLHCDPCENVCDKPLLYERGWKKKLTYVIAFSRDTIQDVTWRYSRDRVELMSRRKECREEWLVAELINMRGKRFIELNLNASQRFVLMKELVRELVQFIEGPLPDGDNVDDDYNGGEGYSGRTTGSLEWRLARGEIGSCVNVEAAVLNNNWSSSFLIVPTKEEANMNRIVIDYNCALDRYYRRSKNGDVAEEDGKKMTEKFVEYKVNESGKLIGEISCDGKLLTDKNSCGEKMTRRKLCDEKLADKILCAEKTRGKFCAEKLTGDGCAVEETRDWIEVEGWRSLIFSAENIFRKEERDWKKAYLCRKDGGSLSTENDGKLIWKLDTTEGFKSISKIEIKIEISLYEDARIVLSVKSDNKKNNGVGGESLAVMDQNVETSELISDLLHNDNSNLNLINDFNDSKYDRKNAVSIRDEEGLTVSFDKQGKTILSIQELGDTVGASKNNSRDEQFNVFTLLKNKSPSESIQKIALATKNETISLSTHKIAHASKDKFPSLSTQKIAPGPGNQNYSNSPSSSDCEKNFAPERNASDEKILIANEWNELNFSYDCQWVEIQAILKGGRGSSAWQHAQLFRQDLNDDNSKNCFPFRLRVYLRDL